MQGGSRLREVGTEASVGPVRIRHQADLIQLHLGARPSQNAQRRITCGGLRIEQERKFRPFLRGRAHGLLRQHLAAIQQAHHQAGTGAAQPKRSAQGVSRVYRVAALLDARIGAARGDPQALPAVQWKIRIQCNFAFTCGVPMPCRRGNAGEQHACRRATSHSSGQNPPRRRARLRMPAHSRIRRWRRDRTAACRPP